MSTIPGLPTLAWRTSDFRLLSNIRSILAVEPTIPVRRPPAGQERLELVSATDGRTHRVTEWAYGSALAARTGHCAAVCGHVVVLCALVTPPGPPCRRCTLLP
ncbi:hypothetical protein EV378_0793 [Pseudonocardia endophytica]|uniref:Uncharacterized protein n=1 Tax=Pseudonocardia endophytica TaxID=401976 RepID=A0A4V2PIK4_PSEEN|nr:hypothetical protein EV378_0793 [Pseudonocardia endophytica]